MTLIKEEHTWTPGASAITKDFELQKQPICAVGFQWDMLGAGAAATLANAKTQCGTYVYLKDGRGDITPRFSLTELVEYYKQFFGIDPPFQDGTAADNKLTLFQVTLPMGRPPRGIINPGAGIETLYDRMVGWKPVGTPVVHIEVPADANSIDNRHLKLIVYYSPTAPRYTKIWTDYTSITLSTTEWKDWEVGSMGSMLEAFLFETSEYNATLTSDAPTMKDARLQRGGEDVRFEKNLPNIFGSFQNIDVTLDDQYKYFALSFNPETDLSRCIQCATREGQSLKFGAYGGVADAMKAAFSKIL